MGKTRVFFKIIKDTKGRCYANIGPVKDRNGMDLKEAEDIKKRWQDNTEELYKKELHEPDNHDGVITHLESDILECEVRWLKEMATHSSVLAWRIPWTEKPGRLQSMGSHRVGHD